MPSSKMKQHNVLRHRALFVLHHFSFFLAGHICDFHCSWCHHHYWLLLLDCIVFVIPSVILFVLCSLTLATTENFCFCCCSIPFWLYASFLITVQSSFCYHQPFCVIVGRLLCFYNPLHKVDVPFWLILDQVHFLHVLWCYPLGW